MATVKETRSSLVEFGTLVHINIIVDLTQRLTMLAYYHLHYAEPVSLHEEGKESAIGEIYQ